MKEEIKNQEIKYWLFVNLKDDTIDIVDNLNLIGV
jgi:hypothetical protein